MFDVELLRTLLAVADTGSFTLAANRVHRTQSTVSQQIRKLEEAAGHRLLRRERAGGVILPTQEGEVLLGYARRIVDISREAETMMRAAKPLETIRLGVPEDFAGHRLTELLSGLARSFPRVRLDVTSGLNIELSRQLAARELDLAIVKRHPESGPCIARWPERLVWVAGRKVKEVAEPVPLAVFPSGCVYRGYAIEMLETAGRRWRIAYTSQSLIGIQAAISSGLGISILSQGAILPGHRRLEPAEGFPEPPQSEIALLAKSGRLEVVVEDVASYLEDQMSTGILKGLMSVDGGENAFEASASGNT
ncbi:MAG: LysR substrate-binding domain-containing protein [Pseudomonadota bacterium]|uniref:LysR substrate-binding domain-containing protein n=1 Tax=Fodinicurvata fenggangensis TaxID=1121830 RepID=UPI0009DE2981|nr:LysR substrate-binding domain-containing protein [Fodinicurvata fenggangensis]